MSKCLTQDTPWFHGIYHLLTDIPFKIFAVVRRENINNTSDKNARVKELTTQLSPGNGHLTDRMIGAFSRIWIKTVFFGKLLRFRNTQEIFDFVHDPKMNLSHNLHKKRKQWTQDAKKLKTIFIEAEVSFVLYRAQWMMNSGKDRLMSVLYKMFTAFNPVYKTVTVKFNGWQSLWQVYYHVTQRATNQPIPHSHSIHALLLTRSAIYEHFN